MDQTIEASNQGERGRGKGYRRIGLVGHRPIQKKWIWTNDKEMNVEKGKRLVFYIH